MFAKIFSTSSATALLFVGKGRLSPYLMEMSVYCNYLYGRWLLKILFGQKRLLINVLQVVCLFILFSIMKYVPCVHLKKLLTLFQLETHSNASAAEDVC